MVTPVDQIFTRGENISLTCISMGGPGNVYQWEKDGEVVANDSALTLMDIDASSGGSYTCIVSNLAGNDSAGTTLYVAPYIITPLEEQILSVVGSLLSITCEADGFPSPNISLVRVNIDMTTMEVSLPLTVSYTSAGVYRCVAMVEIRGMMFNATDETIVFGKNKNHHN